MYIITRPNGGQFHVCRIIPGQPPLSIGQFDSHGEAMDVCNKLDLLSESDITEEPVPGDLHELLDRL